MTKKEARKLETLLKVIPPHYSFYMDGFNPPQGGGHRLGNEEEWHKMAAAVTAIREMYFKKLYVIPPSLTDAAE